ncbi:MAG: hypothetical protein ABIO33_07695, partial [Leifsonia sp.]
MENSRDTATSSGIIEGMVIRLNPQFPVVWRTPDSIQIGIDRPITVVDHVSIALERVVNLLR